METPSNTEPSAGGSSSSTARDPDPGLQQNTQPPWHTQTQTQNLQQIQDDLINSLIHLENAPRLVRNNSQAAVDSDKEPDPDPFSIIMESVMLNDLIIQYILINLGQVPERDDGSPECYGHHRASVPPLGLEESGVVVLSSEEQDDTDSEADEDKVYMFQPTNYSLAEKYGYYYLYGEETAPSSSMTLDNMEIQMTASGQKAGEEQIEEDAKRDSDVGPSSSMATNQSLTPLEYAEHPQEQDANHRGCRSLSDTAVGPFNNEQPSPSPRFEGSSTPRNNRSNKGKQASSETDCENDGNCMTLRDNNLCLLTESTDMRTFWRSISHLSSGGLRRMARLLPAMNRLEHEDWTNGEKRFVSAMLRNGAPQLESWTALYQTQLEARREMGYFRDKTENTTGKGAEESAQVCGAPVVSFRLPPSGGVYLAGFELAG